MAELNQPRRELKGKTRGFATGRNSRESSPRQHDVPTREDPAAATLVGSIGRGIRCRKRGSACFHLLRHDARYC